jgi:hypothetical protein
MLTRQRCCLVLTSLSLCQKAAVSKPQAHSSASRGQRRYSDARALCREQSALSESSGKLHVSHSPHLPGSGHSLGQAIQAPSASSWPQINNIAVNRLNRLFLFHGAGPRPSPPSAGHRMAETTVTNKRHGSSGGKTCPGDNRYDASPAKPMPIHSVESNGIGRRHHTVLAVELAKAMSSSSRHTKVILGPVSDEKGPT